MTIQRKKRSVQNIAGIVEEKNKNKNREMSFSFILSKPSVSFKREKDDNQ